MRHVLSTAFVVLATAACQVAQPPAVRPSTASSGPLPELSRPVNDFAGVIGASEEAQLDALIRRLQTASGDVIVVATVKTFQPAADIRVYANEMFENYGKGIGQKGKDNGLLVVLAVDDREVWAEVGYDLEGIITDGFSGETSRETMVPFFRRGDYGGGVLAGVAVFARRIADARNVTLENVPVRRPARSERDDDDGGGFPLIFVLFAVMIVVNLIRGAINSLTGGRRGRRRRRWGSSVGPFGVGYGGWSGGGGGWSGGGGFGGGFGGFGGGRSGGGGGGASW